MTPHASLIHAERARAIRKLEQARKRHTRVKPHLDRAKDATTAALRWEMGARHG